MSREAPLALPARATLAAALILSACTPFPDFGPEAEAALRAPYPALIPLDGVLPDTGVADPGDAVAARAAALRARAAALAQR